MSYLRFGAMIITSMVVMFVLMYLNTYALEHVFYSETRVYMAILMGAAMAVIMLGYMLGMYRNAKLNLAIFAAAAVAFTLSLWLVRSQATVSDASYMRAMIPHHSIAIMTSKRAQISDPRVRKLADEIIAAQEREISEMRYLLAALEGEQAPPAEAFEGDTTPEVVSFSKALHSSVLATLDPEPITAAEADKVLPAAPGCAFARTTSSDPVLVARAPAGSGTAAGLMKLNGELVQLRSTQESGMRALRAGPTFMADGVRMAVGRAAGEGEVENGRRVWEADLVFELEQGLTVGYRGFYVCDA